VRAARSVRRADPGNGRAGVDAAREAVADAADQTEDLRSQADAAAGEAKAEAHDAWVSIQAALRDLETRIRGAVDDL
jgi:hypothetical protein